MNRNDRLSANHCAECGFEQKPSDDAIGHFGQRQRRKQTRTLVLQQPAVCCHFLQLQ
jgi:Zn ribbon nucleic-acid-binding protein